MAGAGIGEAMLLGAAMGGGSAALTGGDPLRGALLGGLTGGIGGGISSTLANNAATTAGGTLAGTALGASPTAAQIGTQLGVQGAATGAGSQAALLAEQMAGFGREGLMGLQSAAQTAIPSGVLPSSAITAMGSPVAQTAIPAAGEASFMEGLKQGAGKFINKPWESIKANKEIAGLAALSGAMGGRKSADPFEPDEYDGPLSQFRYRPEKYRPFRYSAGGGIASLPVRRPMPMARGGISDLGSYSDGGRMLRGRGDGMSDSIPGVIAGKRPARLADGEFVVPADVVSHLGNGSTDAGAKQLYAMMDKVRKARTGRKAQGREINPRRFVPA